MFTKNDNLNYWTSRASEKEGWEVTSNDPIMRQLELQLISRLLKQYSTKESIIIDFGCGDGFIESNVGEIDFKEWRGVDPAPALISKAKHIGRMKFHIGDVDILPSLPAPDIFFTIRAIINIPDQKEAYAKIADFCKLSTNIFFCESSVQGLNKINAARGFFGIPPIMPPTFNEFINEEELKKYFDIIRIEHFASAYYFGSRVVNAMANPIKQDYHDNLNVIFKDIKSFGEWGVERLFFCRKKNV